MPSEAAMKTAEQIVLQLGRSRERIPAVAIIIDRAIREARYNALEDAAILAEVPATRNIAIKIRDLKERP